MVGVTQTLIGLPFDTVKVWIQNNKPVVSKNIFDYYRGSRPEFCSAIISNCIVFPSYKYTLDYTIVEKKVIDDYLEILTVDI